MPMKLGVRDGGGVQQADMVREALDGGVTGAGGRGEGRGHVHVIVGAVMTPYGPAGSHVAGVVLAAPVHHAGVRVPVGQMGGLEVQGGVHGRTGDLTVHGLGGHGVAQVGVDGGGGCVACRCQVRRGRKRGGHKAVVAVGVAWVVVIVVGGRGIIADGIGGFIAVVTRAQDRVFTMNLKNVKKIW